MVNNELINNAIEYIFGHIDEKLTVDEVAQYCHMSKYHFSRLFKQEVGESLYSFIKHNRIALSAVNLKVNKEKSVTDVGFGYLKSFEDYAKNITISQLPERKIYYRRFIGSYAELKNHWIQFMADNEKLVTEQTLWIERSFSDPDIVELDRCICDVGMTITKQVEKMIAADASKVMRPYSTSNLPGGKYAVYHFRGHKKDIYTEYQGLFTVWLPRSGHELEYGELYDVIRKFNSETDILDIEICIPIKV